MKDWLSLCAPFCTTKEKVRAEQFLHKEDATRLMLGRTILRKALHLPTKDLAYTDLGKPSLPHHAYHFNLSHSGEMLCLALSQHAPIGIDVEKNIPIKDVNTLIEQLHPHEIAYFKEREVLDKKNITRDFYRCWTRKEALSKACGLGLSLPLSAYAVDMHKKEQDWIDIYPSKAFLDTSTFTKKNWASFDIPINDDYFCSVVSLSPIPTTDFQYILL